MNIEPNNPSAESVENEGEKVTGADANTDNNTQEANVSSSGTNDAEILPQEETKKEDMTGYNEHPDQEKVGGG